MVEKHIFSIAALGRKLLQVSILANAMLQAQLLPELTTDYRESLSANIVLKMYGAIHSVSCHSRVWAFVMLGSLRSKVRGGEQHTVVAALAGLDCDDFPVQSIDISTGSLARLKAVYELSEYSPRHRGPSLALLRGTGLTRIALTRGAFWALSFRPKAAISS